MIKRFEEFVEEGLLRHYNRWHKGEKRNEDKFSPEYIDFGEDTSVLWAKHNLIIDGKDRFSWEEIKDYNNNGWRLPTVDEVKQLNWDKPHTRVRGQSMDDGIFYEIIRFNATNSELMINNNDSKIDGGFHLWTKDEHPKFEMQAYAYGFDNMYKFNCSIYGKFNNLYVFLVKDK